MQLEKQAEQIVQQVGWDGQGCFNLASSRDLSKLIYDKWVW
jgi:hypothetical protein